MKYFICFLLSFVRLDGLHAQQLTRWQGDKSFSVQLVSDDTTKAKVYNTYVSWCLNMLPDSCMVKPKYDTIGPVWRLVSDTTKGWNPASATQVYEVRKYWNDWIMVTDGRTQWSSGQKEEEATPHHYAWLDSRKKPLKLAVWTASISQ